LPKDSKRKSYGYSAGADSAFLLAYEYGQTLNITDVVSLGPTFSGSHSNLPGNGLADNYGIPIFEILLRGADINLVGLSLQVGS
jgi:hypothetical protein